MNFIPGYNFLKNLKLGTMFAIVISGAMIIITTALYWLTYEKTKTALEHNLKSKASSILDFADVLLESRNEKFFSNQSHEVPQVIQGEVFEKFTKISDGKVLFNQSSKHPMNPKHKAKPFEEDIIEFFKQNKNTKQESRFINAGGNEYFVLSRPMIAEERCKMCHPTWTPGDVIAAEHVKINTQQFNADLEENLYLLIGQWLLNIALIIAIVQVLFKLLISDRVNKLLKMMFQLENGNFILDKYLEGENPKLESSKNELDRLFLHLARVANNLKPVINKVVKQSKDVAFRSSVAFVSAKETKDIVEDQAQSINNANATIDRIMELNNDLTGRMQDLQTKSNHSMSKVNEGQHTLEENRESANQANVAMDETVTTIRTFEEFSEEIEKTVETITDIADETNLIALNAAIEAARAGEHGRSFAVVADKIRVLADVSLKNADDIKTVVNSMKSNIDNMIGNANKTKEVIGILEESSHKLSGNFSDINTALDETTQSLSEFESEFKGETKQLEGIISSLNEVTDKSENVASTTKQMQSIMGEITDDSAELKLLSDGFEVVLQNNRQTQRAVISPPQPATISFDSGPTFEGAYVFDASNDGISFFIKDSHKAGHNKSMMDETATLQIKGGTVNGSSRLRVRIVYCNMQKLKNTAFCGCKLL